MSGRILKGAVYHNRLSPKSHRFQYPAFFVAVDVDGLNALPATSSWFGYNTSRLFAIRDADYLNTPELPLPQAIRRYLPQPDITRILLVTTPRVLGYVFNPVSFYLGYNADNHIVGAVAEVNNTFKERHVYVLDQPEADADGYFHFRTRKAFHVSPFNDRKGDYHFRLCDQEGRLEVHIDIERDGQCVFQSGLVGRESAPITNRSILKTLLNFPFQTLLTVPRIHFQAVHLYFRKKMQYFPKPAPDHNMTIKIAPPSWLEIIGMRLFIGLLNRVRHGSLAVIMPDGSKRIYGQPNTEPAARLVIKDYTFFRRILLDGDIGLGEAYMYGQWDTPDLTGLIAFLIANRDAFQDGEFSTSKMKWLFNRAAHLLRSNTKRRSRKNIGAHYDLSNEFFRLFLDPTMLYSAAVFSSPDENLEAAQRNKMKALIDKARIEPHHHVLEIGCGWGGLAIEMAKTTGCRVTGITISEAQYTFAKERVRNENLEDRVSIEFCDYRDVKGSFDRVVSVEMIEAVGHEHFGTYFATIDKVLNQDGLAVLQVITIPHQRYNAYRKSVDWIQKHIFPGGHLPSVEALTDAMARHSRLLIDKVETIGTHYATTLKHWSDGLTARRDELTRMGYDETFYRTWQYYFSYCEAAFATRTLDNLHLVITRAPVEQKTA